MQDLKPLKNELPPPDQVVAATIEGSTTVDDDYEEFPDRETRSIALQLADVGNLDPEEIMRLSKLNEVDRTEEIKNLKKEVRQYLFLMVLVAINTAWFSIIINAVIFYDKNDLGLTGSQNAKIQSILFLPWSFKPLWGYLSDSFFIFGYR